MVTSALLMVTLHLTVRQSGHDGAGGQSDSTETKGGGRLPTTKGFNPPSMSGGGITLPG